LFCFVLFFARKSPLDLLIVVSKLAGWKSGVSGWTHTGMLLKPACCVIAGALGLLLGGRVAIDATLADGREFGAGPLGRPLALITAQLASISIVATDARRGPLPFESLALEGENLQLGWKLPALLAAPFWLILLRQRAPLLIVLLVLLLAGPPGPKGGELRFDLLVQDYGA